MWYNLFIIIFFVGGVKMKSILIGNGINIQFGHKAYTSDFIIKRAYFNAIHGKYSTLFANKIANNELGEIIKNFISIANQIISGEFDYVKDVDLQSAIQEFKTRYKISVNKYSKIMLEDWFLLIRIFFVQHSDIDEQWISVKQGFEQIFLDAIFNDGYLENVYTSMPKKVSKYLKKFDNIFSLNYDSNIEKLTKKKVYHLHGCFDTLGDGENQNTVLGYLRLKKGDQVIQKDLKHCFCNALLDYSGMLKMRRAEQIHQLDETLDTYRTMSIIDPTSYESILSQLQSKDSHTYDVITTAVKYPFLLAGSDYRFKNLQNLSGELVIIGMSPNNDSHVFQCIEKSNLDKVVFYNFGSLDVKLPISKPYEILDINKLWDSLGAANKTYTFNVKLPTNPKVNDFFKLFDTISLDKEPMEAVKTELKSLPQLEINRLCRLAMDLIKQQKADGAPKTEADLLHQFSMVSSIALREGILPKTLFLLIIMNFNDIK